MFIAAVARIMMPGCKHDHMPILEGEQDKGKSTAISLLFSPWFTDDLADLGTKDAAMQVRGAWSVEVAELAAMTRGEIERVKAFITRRTDRFRPPYGRHIIEVLRQSVFVGSTNAGRRPSVYKIGPPRSLRYYRSRPLARGTEIQIYR
jgi:predicted P-loop ATPase